MLNCHKCGKDYKNKHISKKNIEKDPFKYLQTCSECRKIQVCKYCKKEFKNNTGAVSCSKECAQKLKEITHLKNYGAKHNFSKNSKSRQEWEKRLLTEEGITNVFQRNIVKEKIKQTIQDKYGVDNISKNELIKKKKKKTLKNTLEKNPNLLKDNWLKVHNNFMKTLGYDPRLKGNTGFCQASNESLKVFLPLIDWLLNNNICSEEDIHLGYEDKNEYLIKQGNKRYFYDFCILNINIIIEFHGIKFHAKPDDKDWEHLYTNESKEENLFKTELKNNCARNKGFHLLEIWSDKKYQENLQICKNYINKKIK